MPSQQCTKHGVLGDFCASILKGIEVYFFVLVFKVIYDDYGNLLFCSPGYANGVKLLTVLLQFN